MEKQSIHILALYQLYERVLKGRILLLYYLLNIISFLMNTSLSKKQKVRVHKSLTNMNSPGNKQSKATCTKSCSCKFQQY